MLHHVIKNTSIGILGIGASVAAPEVLPTDPSTWSAIMEVVTQVVIAVATLFSLFKKKKA